MIRIGRFSGFSLDGETTAENKRALFEKWGRAALKQTGSYDWIHFVCLAECCLLPGGDLGREMSAFHELICGVGSDQKIAARVEKILGWPRLTAQFAGDSPDRKPVGKADRELLRMHADLGNHVRQALRENGPDAALRVALYPSLFLLAWHEMPAALAELLSLPLRNAYPKELAQLGVVGSFQLKKALPAAVKRAAAEGIEFPTDKIDLDEPLAFASSFAAALKRIKWGAPRKRGPLIERRPLPEAVPLFAEDRVSKKKPHARPFNEELRGDHDILLARGLKLLGARADDAPEAIVEKIHRLVAAVQSGKRRLSSAEAAGVAVAWGDQLVRALSWQWAQVVPAEGEAMAGLVSPDRSLSHFPMPFITHQAKKSAKSNTVALFFNMLREGKQPSSKPGALSSVA